MTRSINRDTRSVAIPSEHGGWSLTLEPAILGLLVAFSAAGAALTVAALLGFIARTPLKVVLVDRWRDRQLDRTQLAERILAAEILAIVALAVMAFMIAETSFWWPLAVAAPLILVELWHDMRSKSRHLIPELAGTIGIGSVATAVALAGGTETGVAFGLWMVIGARSIAAVLFVRIQLLRFKGHDHVLWHSDIAQLVAVAIVVVGWITDVVPAAAVVVMVGLAVFELIAVRRTPQRAAVIGARQVVLGLTVVLATALGVRVP
ncbi:MAG: YwiC-like family protein [bacterium]|nr:YwiC-like family protein [bacterium]